MSLEAVLHDLQLLLYGYNYAVFLHCYQLPLSSAATAEEYIAHVLPHAAVGGSHVVSAEAVLTAVEQALRYAGDEGSGPKPTVLASSQFEVLLDTLLAHLRQMLSNTRTITSFWLRQGHPAYPVFWDFAFVFVGTEQVEIFIGSSSD